MTFLLKRKNYNLYKYGKTFVIHNLNKEYKEGHTHVYNYVIAKVIIYTCINKKFPDKFKHLSKNKKIMNSILRICNEEDNQYFEKINIEDT